MINNIIFVSFKLSTESKWPYCRLQFNSASYQSTRFTFVIIITWFMIQIPTLRTFVTWQQTPSRRWKKYIKLTPNNCLNNIQGPPDQGCPKVGPVRLEFEFNLEKKFSNSSRERKKFFISVRSRVRTKFFISARDRVRKKFSSS